MRPKKWTSNETTSGSMRTLLWGSLYRRNNVTIRSLGQTTVSAQQAVMNTLGHSFFRPQAPASRLIARLIVNVRRHEVRQRVHARSLRRQRRNNASLACMTLFLFLVHTNARCVSDRLFTTCAILVKPNP